MTFGRQQNPTGATYSVINFISPTGHFPCRVYPLLSPVGSNVSEGEGFLQILDDEKHILGFERIRVAAQGSFIIPMDKLRFTGAKQPGLFAVAFSPSDIMLSIGEDQFKADLTERIKHLPPDEVSRFPFFYLEVSRYLSILHLESACAVHAVSLIAKRSKLVASIWVKKADLSSKSRFAAIQALGKFLREAPGQETPSPSQRIATIAMSPSSYIQGDLVHNFENGKSMVFLDGRYFIGDNNGRGTLTAVQT